MYVDAITTAALARELNSLLSGGRVQAVLETDSQSIGFEIYAQGHRHYLLMSVKPDAARCQLVTDRLRRGVQHASPLGLLLKKYVDGSRLMAISQPPWERILHFDFSGEHGDTRLIVETMDKRSNIVLTVDEDILDCIKRVGPDQNRYRVLLPGKPYVPPPPQKKASPEQVSLTVMNGYFRQSEDIPAWRVLVNNIAGVSPLFAREIVFFASGDAEAMAFDVAAGMIHAAFSQRIEVVLAGEFTPCVVPSEDGSGYVAFAAYPLTYLERWQPVESISLAMERYFGAPVGMEAYEAAKGPVQAEIDDALDRMQHKLKALQGEAASEEKLELLRKKGELIYAYGANLKPGQTVLQAQYDASEPPISIDIDPQSTYVENAQAYFEKYEKAKRAAQDVPGLIVQTQQEIDYLTQLATDLDMAENWPEIDLVREALQSSGYWRGSHRHGPRGGKPGIRRFTENGFVILVGRNSQQNHVLITERSASLDLWLHARNIPGSHVIVKNDGRPIPDEVVQRAAELAAYYSAGRGDSSVEVDVTERKYVRPIKGGRPGMVTYKNEKMLRVRPQK